MNEEAVKPKTQETEKKPVGTIHKHGENFIERYANNIFFEGSAWDLKLVFGNLDQSIGPNYISQHTAISLPWAQVKLLIYFLRFHLLAHEARMGRVHVLTGIVSPIPATPPLDVKAFLGTTDDIETFKKARKLYEEFVADNPEAVPIEQQKDSKSSTQ